MTKKELEEADRRYAEEDAEGGSRAELRGSSRIQRQNDN